jgi:hypothetical protein
MNPNALISISLPDFQFEVQRSRRRRLSFSFPSRQNIAFFRNPFSVL